METWKEAGCLFSTYVAAFKGRLACTDCDGASAMMATGSVNRTLQLFPELFAEISPDFG